MANVLTIASAIVDATGLAFTITMANGTGTLAANAAITGFWFDLGGSIHANIATCLCSGTNQIITGTFTVAVTTGLTVKVNYQSGNLADSGANTVANAQTNIATTNSSAVVAYNLINVSTSNVLMVPDNVTWVDDGTAFSTGAYWASLEWKFTDVNCYVVIQRQNSQNCVEVSIDGGSFSDVLTQGNPSGGTPYHLVKVSSSNLSNILHTVKLRVKGVSQKLFLMKVSGIQCPSATTVTKGDAHYDGFTPLLNSAGNALAGSYVTNEYGWSLGQIGLTNTLNITASNSQDRISRCIRTRIPAGTTEVGIWVSGNLSKVDVALDGVHLATVTVPSSGDDRLFTFLPLLTGLTPDASTHRLRISYGSKGNQFSLSIYGIYVKGSGVTGLDTTYAPSAMPVWLAYGDSMTYDDATPRLGSLYYIYKLALQYERAVMNMGISGTYVSKNGDSHGGDFRYAADVTARTPVPELVFIEYGTNDISDWNSQGDLLGDTATTGSFTYTWNDMLSQILLASGFSGTKAICMSIFPRLNGAAHYPSTGATGTGTDNSSLHETAIIKRWSGQDAGFTTSGVKAAVTKFQTDNPSSASRAIFVDASSFLCTNGGYNGNDWVDSSPSDYFDGLHPNDQGHTKIAGGLSSIVSAIINRSQRSSFGLTVRNVS